MMRMIGGMLLCICLLFTGCVGERGGDFEIETSLDEVRLVPEGEASHEEIAESVRGLVKDSQDFLARMQEAAGAKGKKAVKLAEKVRKKVERRIAALTELDYDAMTDEELSTYIDEASDIITVIREAYDAIDAM